MDVVIKVRTPQQAAAAVNKVDLNEKQVRQLLLAIAQSSSIKSIIEVADRMSPKTAELACCGDRMRRITVANAGRLLSLFPVAKSYGKVRRELLKKFLRQPIQNWIDDEPFINFSWTGGEEVSEVARAEYRLYAGVVVRSQSATFARELLSDWSAKRFLTLEEIAPLKKLSDQ